MNRVMLDLETMGNSSNAAIIAIGAVKFNEQVEDRFYEVVSLESCIQTGLTMDASTVMWWMQQSDQARAQFFGNTKATSLCQALDKFASWLGKDAQVWGNGAAFDNAILANAYRATNKEQPWKFWNDACYRTVKNMNHHIKLERVGTYHNALDDAESQRCI